MMRGRKCWVFRMSLVEPDISFPNRSCSRVLSLNPTFESTFIIAPHICVCALRVVRASQEDEMAHKREREDYELKRRVEEEALLNLEFQMNQRVASLQVKMRAERDRDRETES